MTIYYVILTTLASIAPILFILSFCGVLDIYLKQPKIYISLVIWTLFAIFANITVYCTNIINTIPYTIFGFILGIAIIIDFAYTVFWWLSGKETKDSFYYRALNDRC